MSYVDEVIDLVVKKNPAEPEFHQAVKEVLESLRVVIEANEESIIEELADMLEVMESIAELHNKTLEDILDTKEKKKIKRGGFSKKLYLKGVEK